MDLNQRKKALARLAQSTHPRVEELLTNEVEKIAKVLATETQYDLLSEQFELLDTFSFRVAKKAVDILTSFIRRIEPSNAPADKHWLEGAHESYQNANTLLVEALDAFVRLRYFDTEKILAVLLSLALHESDTVRNKALEYLETVASYNIDVVYGPERKGGIGFLPQEKILTHVCSFDDGDLKRYLTQIITIARCVLAPTMETTSSTYNTVTWSQASVPAHASLLSIRSRAIRLLKRIYNLADTSGQREDIIHALHAGTRLHHGNDGGQEVRDMIARDTGAVLQFWRSLAETDDFPLIQKIEDLSYWTYYHSHSDVIRKAALEIEAAIAANHEYGIYKTLIGFEGLFKSWDELKHDDSRWEGADEWRRTKASEYAKGISDKNFGEWRQRILIFSETDSEDLATFPIFYQFLEEFARLQPDLVLTIVSQDTTKLERFLIPLLRGLWITPKKDDVRNVIKKWIGQDRYLYQSTKLFMNNEALDTKLLCVILRHAIKTGNSSILNLIVSVVASNWRGGEKHLIRDLLIPAIIELTEHSDTRWVNDFWFRRETKQLIQSLDDRQVDSILRNLLELTEVDYGADEILSVIAERDPEKILRFFGDRLLLAKKAKGKRSSIYGPVPYELHKLKRQLAKTPEASVNIVREWYDGDFSSFRFGGARLLSTIFPEFSETFQSELMKFVKSGHEGDIKFVLAVLYNYKGATSLHEICKEIIRSLPDGSPFHTDIMVALESTGVVSGEFGFAEAYEQKIADIKPWLNDKDEKVRKFATNYIEELTQMSKAERIRAQEQLELRKYRFGE